MSQDIINSLDTLQAHSGVRLPDSIITGFTLSLSRARYRLIRTTRGGVNPTFGPTNGTESLRDMNNRQSRRRLKVMTPGREDNFTYMTNTALLGGESYPVLTAVLGTAAGVASFGAGLLFTAATTGLSLSQTVQRVLARGGDEIWQVEEIGKARTSSLFGGNSTIAVHVGSYFLVDPYRQRVGGSHAKGWLIHEERTELTL